MNLPIAFRLIPLGLLLAACNTNPPAPKPSAPSETTGTAPTPSPSSPPKDSAGSKEPEKKSAPTLGTSRKPPKGLYDPTPPGQESWKSSLMPAVEIARKADARLAALKGVHWYWRIFGDMPEGRSQSLGEGMVVSPSKFRYEYPHFGKTRDEYLVKYTWIADGQNAVLLSRQGVSDPKPVSKVNRGQSSRLVEEFPMRLGELLFAGVGTSQRPLTAYMTTVTKPGSGYKVVTEDRSLLKEGKAVNNVRVLITRPANKAKKLNEQSFELVFNANYSLPVSSRFVEVLPNGKKRMHTWAAQWKLDKGQKFEEKKFELPVGPF